MNCVPINVLKFPILLISKLDISNFILNVMTQLKLNTDGGRHYICKYNIKLCK